MTDTDLHDRLDDVALASLLCAAHPDVDSAEQHAAKGCSRCARVLVNARDIAVELSLAEPAVALPAPLRARLLDGAAHRLRGRARSAAAMQAERPDRTDRVLDPSAAVGAMHASGGGEAVRTAEVVRVGAMTPRPGEGTERVLVQLQRLIGFPILLVSVISGDRAHYRIARGLPPHLAAYRQTKREMSFCTHGVTGNTPLIVEDATNEPFFRASSMVRRQGLGAYFGVPLRTSRAVTIGMLCAMDLRPRSVSAEMVQVLELFAARVAAEIELPHKPSGLCGILETVPGGGELYAQSWFADLLSVELRRTQRARPSALAVAFGPGCDMLASAAQPSEVAGRVGEQRVGLLLSATDADAAARRCADLRRALPNAHVAFAMAEPKCAGPAAWCARALEGI